MGTGQRNREVALTLRAGENEVASSFSRLDVRPSELGTFAQAKGHHSAVKITGKPANPGIVEVQNGGGRPIIVAQYIDELSFGISDRINAVKKLQVDGSDVCHHPHVRHGNLRQASDLTGRRHRKLHDSHLVLKLKSQQRQRNSEVVIEVPFRLMDAESCGQKCSNHFFSGRLAHATRDSNHTATPLLSNMAGEGL